MEYHLVNACINSNNNAAASCKNLVHIGPVTSELKRVESAISATTRSQFDDHPALGTLAFKMDCNITIPISAG